MYAWQLLDADHYGRARALGGDLPDRLAHRRCNRAAGAVLGNRLRGARRATGATAGLTRGRPGRPSRVSLPSW